MSPELQDFLRLAPLGFIVGAYGTLVGAGGGSVLVPALLLMLPQQDPASITAISLAVVFFNAYSGTIAYVRMGRVDFRSGIMFTLAGLPGAVLGVLLVHQLPRALFDPLFGCLLLGVGGFLVISPLGTATNAESAHRTSRSPRTDLIGSIGSAYIAVLSSLLGIGGGIIHVPFLIRVLRMPPHNATATSHFVLTFMALVATITHVVLKQFDKQLLPTMFLAVGVMMGAPLGAAVSSRLQGSLIVRLLALALCLVGIRLLSSRHFQLISTVPLARHNLVSFTGARMAGKKPFDYLVVGCGLFGGVFARAVAERGCRVLLVDRRPHIGGNCYTELSHGVHVHKYGPHIFHTKSAEVWQFVNRFADFLPYRHRGCVLNGGRLWSFPINLATLHQLWGVTTPREAQEKLAAVRIPIARPENLEEWILSQVGRELYELFIKGYTEKQWGRDARELPPSIIRRIPIRLTYNDAYFDDPYQGIPDGGYTALFQRLLDHPNLEFETGVDFFAEERWLRRKAAKLVFSGKIDEFYDYRFGRLEYRSLRFEEEVVRGDFQGTAIVNYTERSVLFTRITEHKHFANSQAATSVITREYPAAYGEAQIPFYPIRDAANSARYERYRAMGDASGVIFGGRLGSYCYYDMDQVIAQAIATARRELAAPAFARAA